MQDKGIGAVLVCAPASLPSLFDDDLFGACSLCGERVRFRPHAPPIARICLLCFFARVEPGQCVEVTGQTIAELTAIFGPTVPKC